jgi:hypothetical protein
MSWTAAAYLQPGDELLSKDGKRLSIVSVTHPLPRK